MTSSFIACSRVCKYDGSGDGGCGLLCLPYVQLHGGTTHHACFWLVEGVQIKVVSLVICCMSCVACGIVMLNGLE